MKDYSLGATSADEALRVVRALGGHRYVAGRLHLVHALALASLGDDAGGVLAEGRAWAQAALSTPDLDAASRDERLWRRSADAELVALLEAFWVPGARSAATRTRLQNLLAMHELAVSEHAPFDETAEEATHPLLIDAGWELVALSALDPERHRGAISAFEHALAYESACFEEQTAIPPTVSLYELPALGPVELLRGSTDDGALVAPLVVWADGHEIYVDYVIRGVRRAAKLPEVDPDDDDARQR
jgi:hypothetical protein